MKTYFQPSVYSDDGTNINYGYSQVVGENGVFSSQEIGEDFLESEGYDLGDIIWDEIELSDEEIECGDFNIIQ
jgi:hypothetical protein